MTEEKIQDYVMGNLPPDEASVVAKAIAADPDLARLADQHTSILKGFQLQRKKVLTEELTALEAGLPSPGAAPPKGGGAGKWVLGLFVILLVTGILFQRNQYSDTNLAERYFEMPLDPRVAGPTQDVKAYYTAINDFFGKRYAAAQEGFTALQNRTDYASDARFYLAHAAYRNGDHVTAATAFREAIADRNLEPGDLELVRWNSAINDLHMGQDVSEVIGGSWNPDFDAPLLREDLSSWWRRW